MRNSPQDEASRLAQLLAEAASVRSFGPTSEWLAGGWRNDLPSYTASPTVWNPQLGGLRGNLKVPPTPAPPQIVPNVTTPTIPQAPAPATTAAPSTTNPSAPTPNFIQPYQKPSGEGAYGESDLNPFYNTRKMF